MGVPLRVTTSLMPVPAMPASRNSSSVAASRRARPDKSADRLIRILYRTFYYICQNWILVLLRNATPSLFHQRHIGRVLRSSCNIGGRRLASSRGREPRPGRCPPLWPGDLRNDGGSVPAAGADGSEA